MIQVRDLLLMPQEDITYEVIRDFVAQRGRESTTFECKVAASKAVPEVVSAFANSHGGVLLVGVSDKVDDAERIVGVSSRESDSLASTLWDRLDPPWSPPTWSVAVPGSSDRHVLVIRIDVASAPRPLLVDGKAYLRLDGRNVHADSLRLRALFTETPQSESAFDPGLRFLDGHPALIPGPDQADLVVRTGYNLPLDPTAAGRALQDNELDNLVVALRGCRGLPSQVTALYGAPEFGLNSWRRAGRSHSGLATLRWDIPPQLGLAPMLMEMQVEIPGSIAAPPTWLQVTFDVVLDLKPAQWDGTTVSDDQESRLPKLSLTELWHLLDQIAATMTDRSVAACLASLAGHSLNTVGPRQPRLMQLRAARPFSSLLHGDGELRPVEDSQSTVRGEDLRVDGHVDLSKGPQRAKQVDNWLRQIIADAGYRGAEDAIELIHETR